MASTPWLTLFLIYTLLFNAFGLPLQKASNRADANKRGHTAKAENDQVISEGENLILFAKIYDSQKDMSKVNGMIKIENRREIHKHFNLIWL